jgi:hypothetical protein
VPSDLFASNHLVRFRSTTNFLCSFEAGRKVLAWAKGGNDLQYGGSDPAVDMEKAVAANTNATASSLLLLFIVLAYWFPKISTLVTIHGGCVMSAWSHVLIVASRCS